MAMMNLHVARKPLAFAAGAVSYRISTLFSF